AGINCDHATPQIKKPGKKTEAQRIRPVSAAEANRPAARRTTHGAKDYPRFAPIHSTGCRMKKFRITSSTPDSAGSLFHSAIYSGSSSATPPNRSADWRIGQSLKYITSGGFGHFDLSRMYGNMNAIAFRTPRPSGIFHRQRYSPSPERISQIAAMAS